mmetsp:Transcript_52496/g.169175  ORF Transcript_52496/g.169175 Transcript_52496/m.169175 type:complete len:325 (+) Transcript_52496:103-1077(+)
MCNPGDLARGDHAQKNGENDLFSAFIAQSGRETVRGSHVHPPRGRGSEPARLNHESSQPASPRELALVVVLKDLAHAGPPLRARARAAVWIAPCQPACEKVAHREVRHVWYFRVRAGGSEPLGYRGANVLADGGRFELGAAAGNELIKKIFIEAIAIRTRDQLLQERQALSRQPFQVRLVEHVPVFRVAHDLDFRQDFRDIEVHAQVLLALGERRECRLPKAQPWVNPRVRQTPVPARGLHSLVVAHVEAVLLKGSTGGVASSAAGDGEFGRDPDALALARSAAPLSARVAAMLQTHVVDLAITLSTVLRCEVRHAEGRTIVGR